MTIQNPNNTQAHLSFFETLIFSKKIQTKTCTCSHSRRPGSLQPFLLNNKTGANEETGTNGQSQAFLVVG